MLCLGRIGLKRNRALDRAMGLMVVMVASSRFLGTGPLVEIVM